MLAHFTKLDIMMTTLFVALGIVALRNMVREGMRVFRRMPNQTKPAKYRLKPLRVTGFRYLGQPTEIVCDDPYCKICLSPPRESHIHRTGGGWTPVRYGQWVLAEKRDDGSVGTWPIDDEEFQKNYEVD
jgi:hypothetical protein